MKFLCYIVQFLKSVFDNARRSFLNAEKVYPKYSFPFFVKMYNCFFIILSFPSRYIAALLVSCKVYAVTRNHTGDSAMTNKVSLCHDIKFSVFSYRFPILFCVIFFRFIMHLADDQWSRATTLSCLFCNTPRILYCYCKKEETRIKKRIYFRSRSMPTAAGCLPGAAAFRAARTPRGREKAWKLGPWKPGAAHKRDAKMGTRLLIVINMQSDII